MSNATAKRCLSKMLRYSSVYDTKVSPDSKIETSISFTQAKVKSHSEFYDESVTVSFET